MQTRSKKEIPDPPKSGTKKKSFSASVRPQRAIKHRGESYIPIQEDVIEKGGELHGTWEKREGKVVYIPTPTKDAKGNPYVSPTHRTPKKEVPKEEFKATSSSPITSGGNAASSADYVERLYREMEGGPSPTPSYVSPPPKLSPPPPPQVSSRAMEATSGDSPYEFRDDEDQTAKFGDLHNQLDEIVLGKEEEGARDSKAPQAEMKESGSPAAKSEVLADAQKQVVLQDEKDEYNPDQDPENLEENKHEEKGEAVGMASFDAIARETARLLGGVIPKPAPPTQSAVGGYVGRRGVENGDIKNSSASGNIPKPIPTSQRGSDQFVEAKETHSNVTDTLRPSFGIAPNNGVIPSIRQQVNSDVLFNDFGTVAPGFGLGVTNKLFLFEEARDKKIVYREPLCEPRKYDGPSGCVQPIPLELQNEITRRDRAKRIKRENALEASGAFLETRAGAGSLNILGDDFGALQRTSDKGLAREPESPLEPIVRVPQAWERVKPLPGVQLNAREMRDPFDALRYPERFHPNMAMNGGPVLSKRNALSIFPFPIQSN